MVTRSAKRRLLQQRTSTAKRRNITEPEDSPTLKRAEKSDKTTAKSSTTDATEGGPSFFLFKSEPESRIQNGHEMKYSIDDLAAEPDQTTYWDGVRNAEARNTMKAMKKGDLGFFYHSNTRKSRPGIIGIVEVVKEAYPGKFLIHELVLYSCFKHDV